MSESFNKEYKPNKIRYKPALYKSIIMLLLLVKYKETNIIKNSKKKKSENTKETIYYKMV